MTTLPTSSFLNLPLGVRSPLLSSNLELIRTTRKRNWNWNWRPISLCNCNLRKAPLRPFPCRSIGNNDSEEEPGEEDGDKSSSSSERNTIPTSVSSRSGPPGISPHGDAPLFSSFQVDSVKLMDLLGPEKVDQSDVKLIKDKLFGYSTFWVTKEESFGDLGEGILFLGNLRGNREEVFAKLQKLLRQVTGDKYNLFMVEEPNSEGPDPRGGPRVSFGLLRKEVSEPGPTTLWQYVISVLLFLLTIGSCVELGIASQACTIVYATFLNFLILMYSAGQVFFLLWKALKDYILYIPQFTENIMDQPDS